MLCLEKLWTKKVFAPQILHVYYFCLVCLSYVLCMYISVMYVYFIFGLSACHFLSGMPVCYFCVLCFFLLFFVLYICLMTVMSGFYAFCYKLCVFCLCIMSVSYVCVLCLVFMSVCSNGCCP